MILERSMHPQFLSNTYLVAASRAARRSSSTPAARWSRSSRRWSAHGLTPTHVLLTHHHYDHVSEVGQILERWPDAQVLIHPPSATRSRRDRHHGAGDTSAPAA